MERFSKVKTLVPAVFCSREGVAGNLLLTCVLVILTLFTCVNSAFAYSSLSQDVAGDCISPLLNCIGSSFADNSFLSVGEIEVSSSSVAGDGSTKRSSTTGGTLTGCAADIVEDSYTLSPVKSEGPNVITYYVYDEVSNTVSSQLYEVKLNKTTYGDVSKSSVVKITSPEPAINGGNFTVYYKYNDTYGTGSNSVEITTKKNVGDSPLTFTYKYDDEFSDYVLNEVSSSSGIEGGFIDNSNDEGVYITKIFLGNYVSSDSFIYGGMIDNESSIKTISGDFIGNYVYSSSSSFMYGGMIDNFDFIGTISGDFIGNYVYSSSSSFMYGGMIYNYYLIGTISSDFIGNYVYSSSSKYIHGGMIYSEDASSIGIISGDFIGNYVSGSSINGGMINNFESSIGTISGDFIGNHVSSYSKNINGGMIYNRDSSIGTISGDFIGNYVYSYSKNIYGGMIYNRTSSIETISGDFIGNYVSSSSEIYGGMIYNFAGSTSVSSIKNISGTFINNAVYGISGVLGGVLYNESYIKDTTNNHNATVTFNNAKFLGNYAISENGTVKGAVLWTNSDVIFNADNGNVVFSGNYVQSKDEDKVHQAIWVERKDATLNFNLINGGTVIMDDSIDGDEGYGVVIKGDNIANTTFYLRNDINNANVWVRNTTLNTVNNDAHNYVFNMFTLNGDTKMVVDVDLAKGEMDRISAKNYGDHGDNKLTVSGMNLMSYTTKPSVKIPFAEEGLAKNVDITVSKAIYSPIYKYAVNYDPESGSFLFVRGAGSKASDFNPNVLSSSVTTQTSGFATVLEVLSASFRHSDNFMSVPHTDRMARINRNKYAGIANVNSGVFSPLFESNDNAGYWFKPYATFENIPFKNGPKVQNIIYGSIAGYDTDIQKVKHGFNRVFTTYIGYSGATQYYNGIHSYQNGGFLGFTTTLYKGNFFSATTVTAGALTGEVQGYYGTDYYTTFTVGVGNKTGYNIEFKNGKFIIQPAMMLSYSFVNTFDYTNVAGIRIDSDPLNVIQIAPGG